MSAREYYMDLETGRGLASLIRSERVAHLATLRGGAPMVDRKSTRLNSSHSQISYAVFCLKKKNTAQALFLITGTSHPTPALADRLQPARSMAVRSSVGTTANNPSANAFATTRLSAPDSQQ